MPTWDPTVADVAALIRVRTKPRDGQVPSGTFDENTTPTDTQVEELITQAAGDVESRTGTLATALEDRAAHVAALYAAMLVELSYFPEQIDTDQSPYDRLKELYDNALAGLLAAVLGNAPRKGLYTVPVRSEVVPLDGTLP